MPESPSTPSITDRGAARMTVRRRSACAAAGASAVAGAIMLLSAVGAPNAGAVAQDKVTFCHETGSDTNVYVEITTAAAGAADGHYNDEVHNHGQGQITAGDIIPPFDYTQGQDNVSHFPGQNLGVVVGTVTGQQILDNGCVVPEVAPSTTESSTGASSTGASSTGASSTGASSTGASSTGASSTGASSTGASTEVVTSTAGGGAGGQESGGQQVGGQQLGGQGVGGVQQGPIPAGVNAGLHTPVTNAGLRAWGIVLMLLGGAAGLVFGLRPASRRAH